MNESLVSLFQALLFLEKGLFALRNNFLKAIVQFELCVATKRIAHALLCVICETRLVTWVLALFTLFLRCVFVAKVLFIGLLPTFFGFGRNTLVLLFCYPCAYKSVGLLRKEKEGED